MKKLISVLLVILFIFVLILSGKENAQINKENALADSIATANAQTAIINDSIVIENTFSALSTQIIFDAAYNLDLEEVEIFTYEDRLNIIQEYQANREYYNNLTKTITDF